MSNANCPCKECVPPKRCVGCHGVCAEYIAWSKKHIRHKIAVNAAREKQKICDDCTITEIRKSVKKRHEIEKLR